MSGVLIASGICIVVSLVLSALFSGSETGFLSLNKMKLRSRVEAKDPKAKLIQDYLKNKDRLLAGILVGNNITIVVSSALATYVAVALWGDIGTTIATVIMTVIIVQFCEILPKALFRQYADSLVDRVLRPFDWLMTLLTPLAMLFATISRIVTGAFSSSTSSKKIPFVTREEVSMIVREGEQGGVLEAHERDMIHSIIEFRATRVEEAMVPLTDVIAVDYEDTLDHIMELTHKHEFTRFPVFKERVDNIIGVINVYDLLYRTRPGKKWQHLVRECMFVPESKGVHALIRELQKKHEIMAVVVNEYGSSVGIITIEDMMEEIVGEIYDKEDEKSHVRRVDDSTLLIDGRAEMYDLNNEMSLGVPEGDYETISGYILEKLGRIPKVGDTVKEKHFTITIKKMDKNRILSIEFVLKDN